MEFMIDAAAWMDVQNKLAALQNGQTAFEGKLSNLQLQQAANHAENTRRIGDLEVTLNGIPGDDDSPGVVRKIDTILVYGKSGVFWAKAAASLLTLILLLIGTIYAVESSRRGQSLLDPAHHHSSVTAHVDSQVSMQ